MYATLILIHFSLQYLKLFDNGSDGPNYVANQLQASKPFSLKWCFLLVLTFYSVDLFLKEIAKDACSIFEISAIYFNHVTCVWVLSHSFRARKGTTLRVVYNLSTVENECLRQDT